MFYLPRAGGQCLMSSPEKYKDPDHFLGPTALIWGPTTCDTLYDPQKPTPISPKYIHLDVNILIWTFDQKHGGIIGEMPAGMQINLEFEPIKP